MEFCLTYIHSLLNSRITRSFEKVKQASVPWLLDPEMQLDALKAIWEDEKPPLHSPLETAIFKVIEKTTARLGVFHKLLIHYYTESQRAEKQNKVKAMLEETASLLCTNLNQCLSLANEQHQDLDTKKLCFGLNKLASALKHTSFDQFLLQFTEGHIERHFHHMDLSLKEFHLKEVWALDLQNPGGTGLPRLCFCFFIEAMTDIKSQLPGYAQYSLPALHAYINICISSFVGAMLEALTQGNALKSGSKISGGQKVIRVVTNLTYFAKWIAPAIFEAGNNLFAPEQREETDSRFMLEVRPTTERRTHLRD